MLKKKFPKDLEKISLQYFELFENNNKKIKSATTFHLQLSPRDINSTKYDFTRTKNKTTK